MIPALSEVEEAGDQLHFSDSAWDSDPGFWVLLASSSKLPCTKRTTKRTFKAGLYWASLATMLGKMTVIGTRQQIA